MGAIAIMEVIEIYPPYVDIKERKAAIQQQNFDLQDVLWNNKDNQNIKEQHNDKQRR